MNAHGCSQTILMHSVNSAQFNRVISESQVHSKPRNESTRSPEAVLHRCEPRRCQHGSACALAHEREDRKELSPICTALGFTAVHIDVLAHIAAALIILCCITCCQARQATAITSTRRQPKQTEKQCAHGVSLLRPRTHAHTHTELHVHGPIDETELSTQRLKYN